MTAASDRTLFEQWRAGDKRAGKTLVRRYFEELRRYFYAKTQDEYEDLVSMTVVRLLEAHDRYRGEADFRVFLFGVARNILREHYRQRRKDLRVDPFESSAAELGGHRLSSVLRQHERFRVLFDALRQLPLYDQELLELKYWQRFTAAEIGRIQGVPESTIGTRLQAARKRLRVVHEQLCAHPHERDFDDETAQAWMDELRVRLDEGDG